MSYYGDVKKVKQEAVKMSLGDLWELCYQAHSNTSFSPEARANMYVKTYSEMLDKDLLELGESSGNYKEKFILKFSNWMMAKGRCISSMITGPANFPVRRAQKANDSERNRSDEFFAWRVKYFKAVNRVPWKSPEDEQEIAENKLENLILVQIEMKEINAEVRRCKIDDYFYLSKHLKSMGFNEHLVSLLDNHYSRRTGKFKIMGFVLSNNNAKINSTRAKVNAMQSRIERKNNWEDIAFSGGRVTIEDDRVKIFHDQKPDREIIQEIKKGGYRWSPNWGCWCRKHTGNAIHGLKSFSFLQV